MPSFNFNDPHEGSNQPIDEDCKCQACTNKRDSDGYISDDDALSEMSSDFK